MNQPQAKEEEIKEKEMSPQLKYYNTNKQKQAEYKKEYYLKNKENYARKARIRYVNKNNLQIEQQELKKLLFW